MRNPVLVEVMRGALVESRHRGAVAVVDADGATVLALGDVAQPVYPRSAVKPMQALPLIESGAADRYGFGDEELALACASHGGEPAHVEVASRMLARAGLDARGARMRRALAVASGLDARRWRAPAARRRRCTTIARASMRASSASPARPASIIAAMWRPGHAVQREVRAALEGLTGVGLSDGPMRHRRLLDPDLGGAADRAGARVRALRHRARPRRRAREGGRAPARGLRGAALLRRRHRALLHRDHEAVRRARAGEDRRRRRVLRRAARAGARHRAQMRGRRDARGRSRDGGDDRALPADVRTTSGRRSTLRCGRPCATGTASRSADCGRATALSFSAATPAHACRAAPTAAPSAAAFPTSRRRGARW